jgi:hypothetical protein
MNAPVWMSMDEPSLRGRSIVNYKILIGFMACGINPSQSGASNQVAIDVIRELH